jgi:hypothetical protein
MAIAVIVALPGQLTEFSLRRGWREEGNLQEDGSSRLFLETLTLHHIRDAGVGAER